MASEPATDDTATTRPPTDDELALWDRLVRSDAYLDIADDLRLIAEVRRMRAELARATADRDAAVRRAEQADRERNATVRAAYGGELCHLFARAAGLDPNDVDDLAAGVRGVREERDEARALVAELRAENAQLRARCGDG